MKYTVTYEISDSQEERLNALLERFSMVQAMDLNELFGYVMKLDASQMINLKLAQVEYIAGMIDFEEYKKLYLKEFSKEEPFNG